jgi:hypothetical protein
MSNVLEIVGIIVGVIGLAWAFWESHNRKAQGQMVFGFLRGENTRRKQRQQLRRQFSGLEVAHHTD